MNTRFSTMVAGAVVMTAAAWAGKLDSFEESVGGARSSSSSSADNSGSLDSFEGSTSSSRKGNSNSRGHGYDYIACRYCRYHHHCLFHDYFYWYDYGIDWPRSGVNPMADGTNHLHQVDWERSPGSPILPRARFDIAWQSVEDDVQAMDYALEVGYSAVAVRGRITRYEEDAPSDRLDLSTVLLLWRIPLARDLELDAGLGAAELDGNDSQTGLDVSLALRGWIPDRHLGMEYRGEFMDIGTSVDSHDFSLLLHLKWFAIRAGYRWVHTTGNSLDGPFAGASVSF